MSEAGAISKRRARGEREWPADRVERWDIDKLIEYANNSRTHSPEQIKRIANSIRQFGFTMPVLVDPKGVLIAGHARVRAAKRLRLASIPVMVARGWTKEQRRAYTIADNALSLNGAGWDTNLLKLEITDLDNGGFDLEPLGITLKDLGVRTVKDRKGPALGDDLTYQIVVDCKSEEHQAELLEMLRGRGVKCRPLIL